MDDDMQLAQITITKRLTDSDVPVDVEWSEGLSFVDALGMLAFAQWFVARDVEQGLP